MRISVKSNIRQASATLSRIQKKQIPFAAMQALNDTAFLIRNDVVKVLWPRSVRVKSRGFAAAAFRVKPAKKTRLQAWVYDRLDTAIFQRQEKGGIRVPYSSTHLAIPTRNAVTASGRIKKAARIGTPGLFKMTLRDGRPGLWRRVLTKRGRAAQKASKFVGPAPRRGKRKGAKGEPHSTLQLMYTLEPRANIDRRFPFHEFGRKVVDVHFSRLFDKRLKVALLNARARG